MTRTRFGDWLKNQRRIRGLTQAELEGMAGLGYSYVSRIENGRTKMPEEETRARIHEALGTSEDDLVEAGVLQRIEHGGNVVFLPTLEQPPHAFQAVAGASQPQPAEDAADIPAHLRASFLKAASWSPGRQKTLEDLINDMDAAAQIERDRLKRDMGE